jgi:catechol 2,3-dioxygenase-like lactoylglutathione lyase family enzyme
MFDHVSIGVRDLARAKRFYDAALHSLGYVCLSENADALGYGRDKIGLWIGKAARPVPSDTDQTSTSALLRPH